MGRIQLTPLHFNRLKALAYFYRKPACDVLFEAAHQYIGQRKAGLELEEVKALHFLRDKDNLCAMSMRMLPEREAPEAEMRVLAKQDKMPMRVEYALALEMYYKGLGSGVLDEAERLYAQKA